MTNNTSGINTEIKVNGQKLETITSFKYLGSGITDEGSKPEILYRIAQTTAALRTLKAFFSVPRYDCCAPLSHPSFFMLLQRRNCSGSVMSPVHQVRPKPSCKAQ